MRRDSTVSAHRQCELRPVHTQCIVQHCKGSFTPDPLRYVAVPSNGLRCRMSPLSHRMHCHKLAFHDADTDTYILADILARIFAGMLACWASRRGSSQGCRCVSVSASWNSSYIHCTAAPYTSLIESNDVVHTTFTHTRICANCEQPLKHRRITRNDLPAYELETTKRPPSPDPVENCY